ncbi:MAG: GFA family protein [Alphaproteobacteria bacterium]
MADASASRGGGCLCGAVRYRVTGPLRDVADCHCSQCRRWHGHVGAYTSAPRASVELLADEGLAWYRSSAEARRGFCRICGSSLFWDGSAEDTLDIAAGTLDAPTGLQTVRHIFTASKGDYYAIADGLPQFPESA